MRAQLHLRDIFLFLNIHAMNGPSLAVQRWGQVMPFDSSTGDLVDAATQEKVRNVVVALVAWSQRLKKLS